MSPAGPERSGGLASLFARVDTRGAAGKSEKGEQAIRRTEGGGLEVFIEVSDQYTEPLMHELKKDPQLGRDGLVKYTNYRSGFPVCTRKTSNDYALLRLWSDV